MNALKQMSDDEISFAIRYLDPDLDRDFRRSRPNAWTAPAPGFAAVTAGTLYVLFLRWLPTLVRLMR